jgi:subtilisin family serine protease
VLNLSLSGSEEDPEETDEIADAIAGGVVVVAPAGNDAEFSEVTPYPACLSDVIGVAAVDDSGNKATFSNSGGHVFIAAPGVDVGSTAPTYSVPDVTRVQSPAGANMSGTSISCTIVAGVVARMLAVRPDLSVSDLRAALRGDPGRNSARDVGLGVVDAAESLRHL